MFSLPTVCAFSRSEAVTFGFLCGLGIRPTTTVFMIYDTITCLDSRFFVGWIVGSSFLVRWHRHALSMFWFRTDIQISFRYHKPTVFCQIKILNLIRLWCFGIIDFLWWFFIWRKENRHSGINKKSCILLYINLCNLTLWRVSDG